MIGTKVLQYRISGDLGDGGHAFVFKGEGDGETVAIKMLKPSAVDDDKLTDRFMLEAESLRMLKHPAIVGFKGYECINGYHYLVLEFMDRGSVDNLFHTNGPIAPKYAVPIIYRVLEGIAMAHDRGIIHRDIKPNNILINSKGEAKLSDFGIAKVVGGQSLTRKGYALGTMGYMAPELISQGQVTTRTDIYALGVTLYEMVTTRKPFEFEREDESPVVFARRVCQGRATPPSAFVPIPEDLERIIMKAIAQSPNERYASVKDLAKDLKKSFPEYVSRAIEIEENKKAKTRMLNAEEISRALEQQAAAAQVSPVAKFRVLIAVGVAVLLLALAAAAPKFVAGVQPMILYGAGAVLAAIAAAVLLKVLPRAADDVFVPTLPKDAVEPETDPADAGDDEDSIPHYEGFQQSSEPFQMTEDSELNAYLTVVAGPDRGRRFGLRPVSRIGRDLRLDIRPHDPEISRHHAGLTFDGQGFTAEDLGSTNGTFVNEERLVGRRRMKNGDILRVGASSMKFEYNGGK